MNYDIDSIGLNFDNSFIKLPKILMTAIKPNPVKSPEIIIVNHNLAKELNLNLDKLDQNSIASFLSGNILPKGSNSIAQAYAGHQFGYFTMLGDGRVTLIGEHITLNNKRYDIQLKGSGRTPYSRNGDGRATITSMLREYLISESMNALKIKTTRSLSVVSSGENVQREKLIKGGILARVASSHIRVGTFQYLSMKKDLDSLKKLINYCVERHYPEEPININPAITLLKCVLKNQISLIIDWMRVGFIHGVMNTDNVTISGETIDYGPCAFMDSYNPQTFFSSIDEMGRYSFENQSIITHWNISRFAETLIPFFDSSYKKSIDIGKGIINQFDDLFNDKWLNMMKKKLGFLNTENNDLKIIQDLLDWMKKNNADYTNTFINLMNENTFNDKIYQKDSFIGIKKEIKKRRDRNNQNDKFINNIMMENNPLVIPRNYIVEKSLDNIDKDNNYELFNKFLDVITNPYIEINNTKEFQKKPDKLFEKKYKTFCGT